mmetsp:Transcript_17201/g.55036  ORF Transcript_17201/g.55036 Transcript_17201/m.55036 type:complete len:206 (-) Transcript_17201:224-841(-)
MAATPTPRMKAREATMGMMKLAMEGSSRASSSERSTSAMTSSITAAAMMSCPVGVLRTPPSWSTLRDMPMEVGARVAPTARAFLYSMSKQAIARLKPISSGTSEPNTATITPRPPTRASWLRSTSIPASRTMRRSPTSPISISEVGRGARSMPCGPTRMPDMISPTRGGRPMRPAILPKSMMTHRVPMRAMSSSKVKGWLPWPPP